MNMNKYHCGVNLCVVEQSSPPSTWCSLFPDLVSWSSRLAVTSTLPTFHQRLSNLIRLSKCCPPTRPENSFIFQSSLLGSIWLKPTTTQLKKKDTGLCHILKRNFVVYHGYQLLQRFVGQDRVSCGCSDLKWDIFSQEEMQFPFCHMFIHKAAIVTAVIKGATPPCTTNHWKCLKAAPAVFLSCSIQQGSFSSNQYWDPWPGMGKLYAGFKDPCVKELELWGGSPIFHTRKCSEEEL